MIVAAGAVERHAEEGLAGGGDDVVQAVVARLEAIGRLVVPDAQAVITGGDERVVASARIISSPASCSRQEPIVRLVLVEARDDVIAIAPGVRLGPVAFVAVRLGIAHDIEPVAAPLFAIMGRGEQPIHSPHRLGRFVRDEGTVSSGVGGRPIRSKVHPPQPWLRLSGRADRVQALLASSPASRKASIGNCIPRSLLHCWGGPEPMNGLISPEFWASGVTFPATTSVLGEAADLTATSTQGIFSVTQCVSTAWSLSASLP